MENNDNSSEDDNSNLSCSTWTSISSTDSDPETSAAKLLDVRSPKFRSDLALKCSDFVPNLPKKPGYNSLRDFKKSIPNLTKEKKRIRNRNKSSPSALPTPLPQIPPESKCKSGDQAVASTSKLESKAPEPYYPIPGRRFLPHQLPVLRPRKEKPNVITLMETLEGPLMALNKLRGKGVRIKVWTKNTMGIRGFCTGFLEAFDKHWNLVLSNVVEKYQRKRHLKTPIAEIAHEDEWIAFKSGEFLQYYNEKKPGDQQLHQTSSTSRKDKKDVEVELIKKGIKTMTLADSFDAGTLTTFRQIFSTSTPAKCVVVDNENKSFSKSQLRKKQLVILDKPKQDFQGNFVIAQSKKFEIIQRTLHQMFLLGEEIVFIETHPS